MRPLLIVDDDPDHLDLSRRLLEKANAKNPIVTLPGGTEAVAYLSEACALRAEGLPAIVFLDIKMPAMDGFAVLRWIRRNKELADVKVIMLSSSDDPNDAKRAADHGAVGFLIKHPHPAVVACVLRQLLGEGKLNVT
jgi:two-component system, response regulator